MSSKWKRKATPPVPHEYQINAIIPMYRGYQLIGDSQLVRFSEQILHVQRHISNPGSNHRSQIGYCVSGQKIGDLLAMLEKNEFPIAKKVIMLIGTNDITHNTPYESMSELYNNILRLLKKNGSKIIVLTVPPVPRLEKSHSEARYLERLERFNQFILEKHDGYTVVAVDLGSLYLKFHNKASREYFEKFFGGSERQDLIHLNKDGFQLLKSLVHIHINKEIRR